ncbi:hypothetical protein PYCC9005_005813 [Savitreella phatthalungensis]
MFTRTLTHTLNRATVPASRFAPAVARTRSVAPIRQLATVTSFNPDEYGERAEDEVDLCIVGGGPAGLAAAIKMKQLAGDKYRVVVLEKAPDMGAHILSGCVMNPRALNELFPGFEQSDDKPVMQPATTDRMYWLSKTSQYPLPAPPQMDNHGNYIVELSNIVRWMSEKAEGLGVELYPGFGGSELLYEDGAVVGVATSDLGVGRNEMPTDEYQRGLAFKAKHVFLAEGAGGYLTRQLIAKYDLRKNSAVSTMALGVKDVWQTKEPHGRNGEVWHTLGWPLQSLERQEQVFGGAFTYFYNDNRVAIGIAGGLDYANPYTSIPLEFQRMKQHPLFRSVLEGGKLISYGARVINEGGLQSVPHLTVPGASLLGCSAGFVSTPAIKGSHYAMGSGVRAAQSLFDELEKGEDHGAKVELESYAEAIKNSWIYDDLKEVRNIRPAFTKFGTLGGMMWSGLDSMILKGRVPFTFDHGAEDRNKTQPADNFKPIDYPKPDNKISFDLPTAVAASGTNHDEAIPVHLKIVEAANREEHTKISYPKYKGLEQNLCPGGVYLYHKDSDAKNPDSVDNVRFEINSISCVHCFCCSHKSSSDSPVRWTLPQSTSAGPAYST